MANQGTDRRTMLEMLAKAAAASQFPGFCRWAFPQQNGAAGPPRVAVYRPSYFTPEEYHTIEILTGLIIPKDESPGAREAGVAEFIDFMAAHLDDNARRPMRDGVLWINSLANDRYGANFAALSEAQQTGILTSVAPLSNAKPGGKRGHAFFRLIRRYTVMGFYTSRIGLEELDFPGLRMYTESPACPHTNDPEHLHLPPPRV